MKRTHVVISVEDADAAAHYLALKLEQGNDIRIEDRPKLQNVSDALYALTNDTDFIVTDADVVPEVS